jgi:hypothetical protein
MLDEHGNVVTPLAQRRQFDGKHIQAIEQVFAEFLFGNVLVQIAIGRGDDTHVDMQSSDSAQPFKLAILQYTQEFGLQFGRHFSDFIRQFDAPDFLVDRPGECALFVSKELAF